MSRSRIRSVALLVLAVVVFALVVTLGHRSATGSSATAEPSTLAPSSRQPPLDPPGRLQGRRAQTLGVADGKVPDGVTVFDDGYPAVTRLEPALRDALRQAATDAGGDGVQIVVNSGWRSRRYQEQLFWQAVADYGSESEAQRWVARPGTSVHESGGAVDVGGSGAAAWMARHGADYDLCQVYADEPWHYELRPRADDHGCPQEYADPTHDPRMQQ